jgi:catechol 2,3-dioxygenase-like lactoylglutathione lyase family enzyme
VKVVKNRVHLDVRAGGGRGEPWEVRWPQVTEAVKRLMPAGATVIHEDVWDGAPAHVVMADPEGNELDVPCRARHGTRVRFNAVPVAARLVGEIAQAEHALCGMGCVPDDGGVTDQVCPTCGRVLDAHNRHVRFRLPDPVLGCSPEGLPDGTWLSHADAGTSVMMQLPGIGAFVRALLPVRLTGGHTVTYGVWVGIHPGDLQRAFGIWWQPEYAGLRLDGALANALQPWGLLAASVSLAVRDPERTLYSTDSPDPLLSWVLTDQWLHAEIIRCPAVKPAWRVRRKRQESAFVCVPDPPD